MTRQRPTSVGESATLRAIDNNVLQVVPARETSNCQEKEVTMKIRPLHDRILVKRLDAEQKTKGGIIIPDSAKEKPIEAMVIAVGNGRTNDKGEVRALEVKAGDRILFGKYSGTEVKIDGEEHLIMREDDVLAVL
jgi:chaperonin GroES